MAGFNWLTEPILGNAVATVVPADTREIPNSLDGETALELVLVYYADDGTETSIEPSLYLWDGTAYQPTGQSYLLDEDGPQITLPGGRQYALYDAAGPLGDPAPTSWRVRAARRER